MSTLCALLIFLLNTFGFSCAMDHNNPVLCTSGHHPCRTKHTVLHSQDMETYENDKEFCLCAPFEMCFPNWGPSDKIISLTVVRSDYTSIRYFMMCESVHLKPQCNNNETALSFSKSEENVISSWDFPCRCETNSNYILRASFLLDGVYRQQYACKERTSVCTNLQMCKVRRNSGAAAAFRYPCVCPANKRCGRLTISLPNSREGARCTPKPPAPNRDPDELPTCSYHSDEN